MTDDLNPRVAKQLREAADYLRRVGHCLDERGRLADGAGSAYMNTLRSACKSYGCTDEQFNAATAELLYSITSERVAAAKERVKGLSAVASAAVSHAKMAATTFAKLSVCVDTLRHDAAELRSHLGAGGDLAINSALPLADLQGALRPVRAHAEHLAHLELWADTLRAREAEILAWPEPSVDDPSTLYADPSLYPTRARTSIGVPLFTDYSEKE